MYLLFGVSDVAARLVAIGFSTATVLVCFELGRTLYSKHVGLLAGLFLALSGYGVLLGRLALLDSTLVFLFSLSLMFFAKWLMTGRDRWLYAFAAALAWTIQAKVTGGLVLVIAVNYLLVSASSACSACAACCSPASRSRCSSSRCGAAGAEGRPAARVPGRQR